ncbi:MAG: methylated-DNA--[protein]-cysteine S-methyltransferase [Chloroflexi bacterium]|nr:methylated-DNA--[protein]-cysteine S-methyltransferase [Chloroflexota bacterium]
MPIRTAIRYTIVDSPLGRLLVAATELGVCAVAMGDDDAALETSLAGMYPAALLHQEATSSRPLAWWTERLLAYLDGKERDLDVPIDVQGTPFQCLVWDGLKRIPYGTTLAYGEFARTLGRPNAVRAVAHACGANPAALVIPCHRVVEAGGGLGGYRWGLERKRHLLAFERGAAQQLTLLEPNAPAAQQRTP